MASDRTPQQALSYHRPTDDRAILASSACDTTYRTQSVAVRSNIQGVSIETSFFDLIQDQGPAPPAGYTQRVPTFEACQSTPPLTSCIIDPCTKPPQQPILATRVRCSALFVWLGGSRKVDFPDKVSSVGKFITSCQFAILPALRAATPSSLQSLLERLESAGDVSEFIEVTSAEVANTGTLTADLLGRVYDIDYSYDREIYVLIESHPPSSGSLVVDDGALQDVLETALLTGASAGVYLNSDKIYRATLSSGTVPGASSCADSNCIQSVDCVTDVTGSMECTAVIVGYDHPVYTSSRRALGILLASMSTHKPVANLRLDNHYRIQQVKINAG